MKYSPSTPSHSATPKVKPKSRIFNRLTNNYKAKVSSLLLATAVWFTVKLIMNPPSYNSSKKALLEEASTQKKTSKTDVPIDTPTWTKNAEVTTHPPTPTETWKIEVKTDTLNGTLEIHPEESGDKVIVKTPQGDRPATPGETSFAQKAVDRAAKKEWLVPDTILPPSSWESSEKNDPPAENDTPEPAKTPEKKK